MSISCCTPSSSSSAGKFSALWLGTWVFDWTWFLAIIWILQVWFTSPYTDPWSFVSILFLVGALVVFLMGRDELMIRILGDVSEYKSDDGIPRTLNQFLYGPASLTVQITIIIYFAGLCSPLAPLNGLLDWHYDVLSIQGAWRMYWESFVFYMWKDIFVFAFIHRAMHENWIPGLYAHHKEHHTGKKNLNVFNATTFDFVDIFLESAGIAYFGIPVMWALGLPIKMHMASFALTLISDVQVHSVNPYSVCWFNPLLDWIFLGNVQHNLHHAKGKGHYMIFPWHHLNATWRSEDIEEYNKIMNTEWEF